MMKPPSLPKPGTMRLKKSLWLSVALGLLILLLGGVIGSGLTLHFLWGQLMTNIHEPNPEQVHEQISLRLDRMLNLDPAQRESVDRILGEQHALWLDLRSGFTADLNELLNETHRRIRAELQPEQQEKWDDRYFYLQRLFIPEKYRAPETTRDGDS